jgi:hypothetical protein
MLSANPTTVAVAVPIVCGLAAKLTRCELGGGAALRLSAPWKEKIFGFYKTYNTDLMSEYE